MQLRTISRVGLVALACCMPATLPTRVAGMDVPNSPLDAGFRLMYNLDFVRAQQQFSAYQQDHSDDPLGPVCQAAGLLFSEFERLGVLESQFYESDSKFDARRKLSPDPEIRKRFDEALNRGENLARARLARDPHDENSLFAMTLSSGLKADYAALIEKRNVASLRYTKESTAWANQLLGAHPDCYDAHLASGISKYIIGSMAAPVRWVLRLGGVSGDKKAGLSELQLTAQRGRYLAPFARILLAIAYVRDKDRAHAREVLSSLREDFPNNPLFGKEITRLTQQ
jgi:hypothetical protein